MFCLHAWKKSSNRPRSEPDLQLKADHFRTPLPEGLMGRAANIFGFESKVKTGKSKT